MSRKQVVSLIPMRYAMPERIHYSPALGSQGRTSRLEGCANPKRAYGVSVSGLGDHFSLVSCIAVINTSAFADLGFIEHSKGRG